MKRSLLFLLLIASAAIASAQTREILRKSIGGAVDLGEAAGADFGLPSWYHLQKIDSVIFRDSVAEIVASTYRRQSRNDTGIFDNRYHSIIKADRQFNRTLPEDSLLRVLETWYGREGVGKGKVTFVGLMHKYPAAPRRSQPATAPKPDTARSAKDTIPAATLRAAAPASPAGNAPLFAGGTALFALGLCAGIIGLYRRAGASS